eukprot:m.1321577 g.1321577  ORF g.1321577 m.1321577 type:complete len:61 (-) comp24847_c0_seq6:224-406(-)
MLKQQNTVHVKKNLPHKPLVSITFAFYRDKACDISCLVYMHATLNMHVYHLLWPNGANQT